MTDLSRRDVLLGTGAVAAAAALPAIPVEAIGNELVHCVERTAAPWPATDSYVLRWLAVPQIDEKRVIGWVLREVPPP